MVVCIILIMIYSCYFLLVPIWRLFFVVYIHFKELVGLALHCFGDRNLLPVYVCIFLLCKSTHFYNNFNKSTSAYFGFCVEFGLECLASWKEDSDTFIYSRLPGLGNEEYRCFVSI